MKELSLEELNNFLKKSELPILVIFKTSWCKMCEIDEIIIKKYEMNNKFRLEVFSIDVDKFNLWRENNNLYFQIDKVPSYKFFYNDQIIYNSEKSISYYDIDNILNSIVTNK